MLLFLPSPSCTAFSWMVQSKRRKRRGRERAMVVFSPFALDKPPVEVHRSCASDQKKEFPMFSALFTMPHLVLSTRAWERAKERGLKRLACTLVLVEKSSAASKKPQHERSRDMAIINIMCRYKNVITSISIPLWNWDARYPALKSSSASLWQTRARNRGFCFIFGWLQHFHCHCALRFTVDELAVWCYNNMNQTCKSVIRRCAVRKRLKVCLWFVLWGIIF